MGRWMKLLALLVFILFVITSTAYFTLTSKTTCIDPSCLTKGCEIKSVMNDKVGPCKDFKSFSCGNSSTSLTATTFKGFGQNLKLYEEQIFNITSEHCEDYFLEKVRTVYKKCYNNEWSPIQDQRRAIRNRTVPFPQIFERNYVENIKVSIEDLEFNFRNQGFTAQCLFSTYLYQTKHPDDTAIYIDYPISTFIDPRVVLKHCLNETMNCVEYERFIHVLFGYHLQRIIDRISIRRFEVKLGTILETHNSQRRTILNTNIVTLSKRFPYFSWEYYFKKTYPNVKLRRKKIVVMNEKYLDDIKTLFEDKYILIIYMIYRNLNEISPFLHIGPMFEQLDTMLIQFGVSFFINREPYCKDLTYRLFGPGITSLIIERSSIKHGGQDIIKDMIQNIKDSFNESISKSLWMDKNTKYNAMKKLTQMKYTASVSNTQIEALSNPVARHIYYSGFCVNKRVRFVNLSVNKLLRKRNNELFYRTKSAFDEIIRPHYHGILYDQNENELIVPVGVLQPHIFDLYWPPYLHYAGIGSAIGRVLIQGFHNMIRQNSEEKQSKIWWSKYTKDKYDRKRDQCLAYSGLFGLNTEGKSNMNDVLDEIEGMNLAYRAYMRSKSKYYFDDPQLDEFEQYTSEQMFFISYGNWFCSSRPQFSLISSITGPFKTPLDIIHKNKNFKDAFGCGKSSYDSKFSRTCMFW